jgi:hypothetical protein
LASCSNYLGTRLSYRNAAGITLSPQLELQVMTTFDKREEGFERKFALDEEQKFKAEARRGRLLGLWVAEKLGLSGDAAASYAKDVVAADFTEPGDADVVRKVMTDLGAKGVAITEQELRAKMDELLAQAVVQVKTGQ